MNHSSPKVSVMMPVYNGERYLCEAIDSVLGQSFEDFELIIINDGSTDCSRNLISKYTDNRIQVIENKTNLGIVQTRKIGMSYAKGEYIAILDCDDIALESRLAIQTDFLDKNPEFAMVGAWAEVLTGDMQKSPRPDYWKLKASEEQIPALLLFNNCFVNSTVMIRRSILPEPVYGIYPVAEDYDLWVQLAKSHKLGMLNIPLVKYRIHSLNTTQHRATEMESAVREIITNQLAALGLKPDKYEIDLHRLLVAERPSMSHKQIRDVENWLLKILQANIEHQIYDPIALSKTIALLWGRLCRHLCVKHPYMAIHLLTSRLAKNNRIALMTHSFKRLRSFRS